MPQAKATLQRESTLKVSTPDPSGNDTVQYSSTIESGCGSNLLNSASARLNVKEPPARLSTKLYSEESLDTIPNTLKVTFPTEPVSPHLQELARHWLRKNFAGSSVHEHIFVLTVE